MRKDEEFAKKAFDTFLANIRPNRKWDDGPDPPDYFLTIESDKSSIEVTQIMESVGTEAHPKSERGWQMTLEAIVKRVEAEMVERRVLTGVYALHLEPAPNARKLGQDILPLVEAYLRQTTEVTTAPSMTLWKGSDHRQWKIEKIGDKRNIVGGAFIIGGAKWQAESQLELHDLIEEAVLTKREKTAGMERPILLLIDAYHYAEGDDWKTASANVDFSGFHTVARVFGEYKCQILHSVESLWLSTG